MNPPVDVFVSYAPADEGLWRELEKHLSMLERAGEIRTWGGHSTQAGEDWRSVVHARLDSARVILLLLSADFFASDQCYDVEVEKALALADEGEARVIPIRVRSYDWGAVPFEHLRALPANGTPVMNWPIPDKAWAEVAHEIRLAIAGLADRPFGGRENRSPPRGIPPNTLLPRRCLVGREDELANLAQVLAKKDHPTVSSTARASLYGLGGVGKTALALEYAHRNLAHYPGGVWWVHGDGGAVNGLVHLASDLRRIGPQEVREIIKREPLDSPPDHVARSVQVALQNLPTPALLILDDVEDAGWSDHLPGGAISIVATTRDRRFAIGAPIPINSLPAASARSLACGIAGDPTSDDEFLALDRVLAELDGLAVAIEMSARAVREWLRSWSTYEHQLHAHMDQMLEDPDAFGDYRRGVFAALDLSIERCCVAERDRGLLYAIVQFAPDTIPVEWALQAAELQPGSADACKAIAALAGLGLITLGTQDETLSIHRLVHRRVRRRAEARHPDHFGRIAQSAMAAVTAWLVNTVDPTQMDHVDARRPHIDAVLRQAEDADEKLYWIFLANNLVNHLHHRARHDEARALLERAVVQAEAATPHAPFLVALCLSNLAKEHKELGDLRTAVDLARRALHISESYYAPLGEDSHFAPDLVTLATMVHAVGEHQEARKLLERALPIYEKSLGEDHSKVASTLSNLALVLRDIGRAGDALPIAERAVSVMEKSGRLDHPDGVASLTSLAIVMRDLGKRSGLLPLLTRVVSITETIYGADHPRVADAVTNLGTLLQDLGHPDQAVPYLERAVKIRRMAGSAHPALAPVLSNLATALQEVGRLRDARLLLDEAITIDEATRGASNPLVAVHLSNLAMLLRDMGDPEKAIPLLQRAIEIDRARGHLPELALGLSNMGNVLCDMERNEEAVPLFEEALKHSQQAYGDQHQAVADQMGNLAVALIKTRRFARAGVLLERATAIDRANVEDTNPSYAITRLTTRAQLLWGTGDLREAARCLERARCLAELKLGNSHAMVVDCIANLADFHLHFGSVEYGRDLIQEGLDTSAKLDPRPQELIDRLRGLRARAREEG